jgi:hypothetical protein
MKIQRLEPKVRVLTFGSLLSVLILLACGWTFREQQSDVLRVRQIVIVDEKGTERVWIGAPVPDPIIKGNDKSVQVLYQESFSWMRKVMSAVGTLPRIVRAKYS